MAEKILWAAGNGPWTYDDSYAGYWLAGIWYSYYPDGLPMAAARTDGQVYIGGTPTHDWHIARRMDVDGTPGTILKAGTDGLPADSVISDDLTNIVVVGRNLVPSIDGGGRLGTILLKWLEAHVGEITLTPKASSSGPEGTMFYDSDDDHVWVATEA